MTLKDFCGCEMCDKEYTRGHEDGRLAAIIAVLETLEGKGLENAASSVMIQFEKRAKADYEKVIKDLDERVARLTR